MGPFYLQCNNTRRAGSYTLLLYLSTDEFHLENLFNYFRERECTGIVQQYLTLVANGATNLRRGNFKKKVLIYILLQMLPRGYVLEPSIARHNVFD